jgi:hypothetical protein
MGALAAVTRVGILWLLSLAVSIAAMEAGHRIVAATDRDRVSAVERRGTESDSLANRTAATEASLTMCW